MKKLDQSIQQAILGGGNWQCFFAIPIYIIGEASIMPASYADVLFTACMNT